VARHPQCMDHEQRAKLFRAPVAQAWELFRHAPAVRFAAVTADGQPLARTFNAVVLDGRLCFHGSSHGQKLGLIGRRALASYDEVVAEIPSYWIHPELACPASTYYVSAIAEGSIERVVDRERKARVLRALMERFQPEGGYDPICVSDPRYVNVLEQLMVAELVPTRVTAKHKLGQHRSVSQIERVLAGLWQRGRVGDLTALRRIREAHPARPTPEFLRGPLGSVLCVAPDAEDARQVAALLEGQYWTGPFTLERMARAQLGSNAWLVARDATTGSVLASARAISDHARFGYVLDVIVRPELRRQGFARALMRLLLDHPALRGTHALALRTRDAQPLYRSLGFECTTSDGEAMVLLRK
jgi:ribosomal protein S18 acetylase RimI-like enzyme/nitroimidazol reductase NimA-like FMN-containing flavoprotein (pyridoxamine 5'-phosphate oxidase superfamily)